MTAFRLPPLINDVFQVHRTTKRAGCKHPLRFFITLTNQGKRYDAIGGPDAAVLTVGDFVRLHGCLLRRGDELVLVICLLKPSSRLEQDESEGSGWKRERPY